MLQVIKEGNFKVQYPTRLIGKWKSRNREFLERISKVGGVGRTQMEKVKKEEAHSTHGKKTMNSLTLAYLEYEGTSLSVLGL